MSNEKERLAILMSDNDQMWSEYKEFIKTYTEDEFIEVANHFSGETQRLVGLYENSDEEDEDEIRNELFMAFSSMVALNKAWEELEKERLENDS